MNKRIKIIASIAMLTPLLLFGVASAQDNTETTNTTTPTQTEVLKQRLEKRKQEMKLRLNAAELRRVSQRCKPSQANVKKVGDKVRANIPQRHKAYEALESHLLTLINKLDAKGVDTTQLKSYREELSVKISDYKADVVSYQQALDDLSAMDCQQDPEAFKASLESARKLREELKVSIGDIRTYVMETVKPALVTLRQELAKNKTEGNE